MERNSQKQLINSAKFANLIELNTEVITQWEIKSALDTCKTQVIINR